MARRQKNRRGSFGRPHGTPHRRSPSRPRRVTVGSLSYGIACDSSKFTAGVAASKQELRGLREAFVASQSPTERYSSSIQHLEDLATKFPEKAATINRAIANIRSEMQKSEFAGSTMGKVWDKIGLNVDPVSLAFRAGSMAANTLREGVQTVINRVEELNQMGHRADLLGVPLRSMIGLSEAAEKLAGADLPSFEAGFTKMSERVAEAAMDLGGEAAQAMQRLNLDPTKLSGMRADQQFLAIADAMQKVENAGERLALSKTLLGKGGVELASMLAAGGDAIRAIAEEEIKASQVDFISQDRIVEAHQAMDDFGDTIKGIENVLASDFAPLIKEVSHDLADMMGAGNGGSDLRATIHTISGSTTAWYHGLQQISESPVFKAMMHSPVTDAMKWWSSFVSAEHGMAAASGKYVELQHGLADQQGAAQAAITSGAEAAAQKAADTWLSEFMKGWDEAGRIEQKAAADAARTKIDAANRALELEDRAYDAREKRAESLAEASLSPSEKLSSKFEELKGLESGGFFDLHPGALNRNLGELNSSAKQIAGTYDVNLSEGENAKRQNEANALLKQIAEYLNPRNDRKAEVMIGVVE
jgi:hypothetical protein